MLGKGKIVGGCKLGVSRKQAGGKTGVCSAKLHRGSGFSIQGWAVAGCFFRDLIKQRVQQRTCAGWKHDDDTREREECGCGDQG